MSTVGRNREGAGARPSDIPGYKGHAVKVIPSRVQRIARGCLQDTASHTKTRTVSEVMKSSTEAWETWKAKAFEAFNNLKSYEHTH